MEKEINLEGEIGQIVKETLEKMGFSPEVEVKRTITDEKETIICNIKTDDSNFLIGQHGVNLQALQHIIRLLVRKKTDERIDFILDVNSYREEKNSSIIKLARSMAEQAVNERRAMVLRPMSPYERRIVHMELSTNSQVQTESIGEGENRKIVIKPVDTI